MTRARNLLFGAISALAIAALPINLDSISTGDLGPAAAHAKGGGNGGGNGNGGGHGGSNGHGSENGKAGANEHGKSADARGHTKSSSPVGKSVSRSVGNMFGAAFGKERSRIKSASAGASATRTKSIKSARASKAANGVITVAALPATVPVPDVKPRNFHAKLAGLNSLKRNYHAYLNSQSPRMAAISAFVMASANRELAEEDVAKAAAALAQAQADFAAAVDLAAPTPYDGAIGVYDDATVESLEARLADLNAATVAPEDLDAWEAEVAAVEALLGSAEADAIARAETSLDEAELAATASEVGTDDEALRAALLDAANENRVAEYGDAYVDDEMMDWAKDLLGVGDAYGKIDEVRDSMAAKE